MYHKLIGTRKTLLEFAKENSIAIEQLDLSHVEECSDCSIWTNKNKLKQDLDGNLICSVCESFYGL